LMNYSYKVPCQKEKLKDIRSFVSEALRKHGVPEVQIATMVLAVDEVCANIIIHTYKCDPDEYVEIIIKVDKKLNCVFEISDQGDKFDITQYQEPSMAEIIRNKRKGGIGLILVRKIMDDIELVQKDGHHVCRLTKKLGKES